ncbi:DUF2264 domain-containing protein [Streptomyces sp. NPDC090106]|uniref:DUF2264 domain-containing protein n=1 Tax=Streptomyces sp. NPDC090106 TaxID=3365946 RepID=UPI00381F04E0
MTAPHLSLTPGPPVDDPYLSPHTGYTRAHWEATADRLLASLTPHATPGLAQYRLPGRTGHAGPQSDGLEGYARSFLLAAFRIAGAHGTDLPGSTHIADLLERYTAGLTAGTDPDHPEHWPPITDRGQPIVEAASIAIALHETRPWLWDTLPDRVRQHTAAWLGGMVGVTTNDSNWRLFQVITEEFLASVGAPHERAEIEAGLTRLDDWYRGDGWYTDGDGRKFDYYNAWALHLYPALWARIAGPRADPSLVARHQNRLREFLTVHQYFFGADGAPVHQGRSLTYRYATAAPLWAAVLNGANPLPPGRVRRLASGALRHFDERGVPDRDGLLSLGWYRTFLPATQSYSGPASPYWASKAFLGLLVPAEHPVWTAREEPGPTEVADTVLALPAPGWLLHSTATDGVVRLVNHGCDRLPPPPAPELSQDNPHYTRFAYSTATAPETPAEDDLIGADNQITLLTPQGPAIRGRIMPDGSPDGRTAGSWHIPRTSSGTAHGRIDSASAVHGPWEVRVHWVEALAGTPVRVGGWAVADDEGPLPGASGPGWAMTRRPGDGLTSVLVALRGGEVQVERSVGRNAYGEHSAVPVLTVDHPGGTLVLAALVVLTADPTVQEDLTAPPARARAVVEADGAIVVTFPDGRQERLPVPEKPVQG